MQRSEMRTKNGFELDQVVSALQKSVRRGLEEESMFWSLELAESGFGKYLWKRLMVISAEDVGIGDPMAFVLTVAGWVATKESTSSFTKPPGMRTEFLGPIVLYLCRAQKCREGDDLNWLVSEKRRRGWKVPVPDFSLDDHTVAGRKMGRGRAFWFAEASKLSNPVVIEGNKYAEKVRELFGNGEQEPSPSLEQGEP